jgi:hypothetical protein
MNYELPEHLQAQIDLAVAQGQINEDEARQLIRQAVLEGTAAGAATAAPPAPGAPPAQGKPWQGLVQPSQVTDRAVVERLLMREGHSHERVLNMLIDAAGSGYRDYQDALKDAKAADEAQRVAEAEHRWLTTTENGRQERERRLTAEAEAIVAAENEAKTRAHAARIILEKREGMPDTSNLSDTEVTQAVFGEKKDDLSNNLAANIAAANAGQPQEGGTQA